MGSIFSCASAPSPANEDFAPRPRKSSSRRRSSTSSNSSAVGYNRGWRSSRNEGNQNLIDDQALVAAATLFIRQQSNGVGAAEADRSSSMRCAGGEMKKARLVKSESSRSRLSTDPLFHPKQLVKNNEKLDDLETKHFVLVHGGGFGAWCWYKIIALLEESGFKVTAIDLEGSGVHSFDSNKITCLAQYVKPLASFLEKLGNEEKVILVGHDFGGTCISHAMESFPFKISKAIYISATMLTNGQSTFDMFSQQEGTNDVMRKAQIFLYENGNDNPPTAINIDKVLLKDLLFNQSPVKDVALASVSMRPVPFAPLLEKLSLTESNYGSVRRFFIETTEDNAIPLSLQQNICNSNPPEKIFRIKGSDHSPFFSKPQALHKLLVEIAKVSPTQQKTSD